MPDNQMSISRVGAALFGGALATFPMTIVSEIVQRQLPRPEQEPLPPKQIADVLMERLGVKHVLSTEEQEAFALASHYGYGALAGTSYALLFPKRTSASLLRGMGFGMAVWAASYLGWLPAMRILPSAVKWPRGRNIIMIAGHLVWGVVIDLLLSRRD